MTIERINGISEIIKPHKVKHSGKVPKDGAVDKINLSTEAKRLSEIERFAEIVKSSPDLRSEKVQKAKERMVLGNYLTEEVADKIAEQIVQSLGIK